MQRLERTSRRRLTSFWLIPFVAAVLVLMPSKLRQVFLNLVLFLCGSTLLHDFDLAFANGQAIGRAHRLGQTEKLTVVRFLVVNTIEHETYLRNYVIRDDDDDNYDDADGV